MRKIKEFKQWITLLCILSLAIGLMAGCTSEPQTQEEESQISSSEVHEIEESEDRPEEEASAPDPADEAEPEQFEYTAKIWPEEELDDNLQTVYWGYFDYQLRMREEAIEGVNQQLAGKGIKLCLIQVQCSRDPSMEEVRRVEQELGHSFDVLTLNTSRLSNADIQNNFESLNDYLENGCLQDVYGIYSKNVWKISDMKGSYYNLNNFAEFAVPAYMIWAKEGIEIDVERWQNIAWEQLDDLLSDLYAKNGQTAFMREESYLYLSTAAKLKADMREIYPGYMIDENGKITSALEASKEGLAYIQQWKDKGYLKSLPISEGEPSINLYLTGIMSIDQPQVEDNMYSIPREHKIYAKRCQTYTSIMQTAPAKQAALEMMAQLMTDKNTIQALYYGGRTAAQKYHTGINLLTCSAILPAEDLETYGYSTHHDYVEAMASRAEISPWQTFLADGSLIRQQMDATSSYWESISNMGFVDDNSQWDVIYENYEKQMREKQIDEVITELQRQVEEWIKE